MEYIKHFAQNTILSEDCDIHPEGILSFLMDIEQMTWRQFCFIEGFSRNRRKEIEIKGIRTSDVNGKLRLRDVEKLVSLKYLSAKRETFYFSSDLLVTSDIGIRSIGGELANLMDLKSIPNDEIARAFGPGMIKLAEKWIE